MIRHQRRLSDCPSRQTFANCAAAHLENSRDKSLFRNTLPITHFDGILCKGGPLISILCAKKRGGGGIPRLPVVSSQLTVINGRISSADGLDAWPIGGEEQIPHRLKPVRDDKKKELGRGANAPHYPNQCLQRLFQRPVKPVRDGNNRERLTAQLKLRPFLLGKSERRIAKSERRIANGQQRRAQSGHLRPGVSNHAG